MNRQTQTRLSMPPLDGAVLLAGLAISCLIAGIVTTVLPSLAAERSRTPTPIMKPELPVAPILVGKKLLGQWLTKEPLDGDMVMFVFAPDGKLFIISGTAASGNAIASSCQYRIDDKPQPMHLDIMLADSTVETLFEFTANGDLRLQMLGTRPGKPRPVALADNATLFQKISDETTPPPGSELKKPSAQTK